MNILFLCREYNRKVGFGGIGTYVRFLSSYFVSLGHKVFVISSYRKDRTIIEHINENFIVIYPKLIRFFGLGRLCFYLGLEGLYLRIICALTNYLTYLNLRKNYKIDVVESPEWFGEGFFFALFHPIPLVTTLHTPLCVINYYSLCKRQNLAYHISDLLEKFTVKKSDMVRSPSQSLVNEIKKHWKINFNNKLEIIEYPYELKFNAEVKQKFITDNETKKILFVGRIEKRKNPEVIIKSIPYVVSKFKNVKFIFVGKTVDKDYKTYLDSIIENYKIKEYVEFMGEKNEEEVYFYRKQSSICVVPSYFENQAYVVLETIFSDTFLLCSDIPAFREIFDYKDLPIFVPVDDEKQWAEKILMFLTNENLKKEVLILYPEIKKKFIPEKICNKILSLYEFAINKFQTKLLFIKMSGFWYALPKKVKIHNIPFKWRKYLIEMAKDNISLSHFYLVTAKQLLNSIEFNLIDRKILDLGSTPIISILFAMLGAEVTIVDIDEDELKKAEKLAKYFNIEHKVKIIKEDLFKIKYENEFDIVFNCGVIEHFKNSAEIIKIMKKAARIDGLVISMVPYFFTIHTLFIRPYIRKKYSFYWWDRIGKERSYTLKKLRKEFESAGLDIKHLSCGNLVRNLCDDHVIIFLFHKLRFLSEFLKMILTMIFNIIDFIEEYTFLKIFGFMALIVGIKKR